MKTVKRPVVARIVCWVGPRREEKGGQRNFLLNRLPKITVLSLLDQGHTELVDSVSGSSEMRRGDWSIRDR